MWTGSSSTPQTMDAPAMVAVSFFLDVVLGHDALQSEHAGGNGADGVERLVTVLQAGAGDALDLSRGDLTDGVDELP